MSALLLVDIVSAWLLVCAVGEIRRRYRTPPAGLVTVILFQTIITLSNDPNVHSHLALAAMLGRVLAMNLGGVLAMNLDTYVDYIHCQYSCYHHS